ncbi:Transcriptional regulator, TetR family [Sphingobium indicum BiD32]|uniref:Transcriptional regulator, TetR family n=1 Tax=Sphingobium indicum BiD32 TaxID=1301087 RepID=N1MUQ9_9SPHN|nr:Transcriptional regulator, TetR family [Sphingobium indicum BiD32]
MLGLREAKKDRTRFQLLEAALDLIARQGFEQTTLNEIADAVQVSPRTLLRYFPTKEDVIVSWVDEGMAVLREGLEARPPGESRPEALLAAARDMLAAYQARGGFFLVIERAIATSDTVAARKQQMMEVLARDVSAILAEREDGQAQHGEARSSLIRDVHVGTVFAIIRASIRSWVGTNGGRPLPDLFDEAACAVRFVET